MFHAHEYFTLRGAGDPGYPVALQIEYWGDSMRILNEQSEVLCYSKLSNKRLDEPEVFDVSFTNTITIVVDQGFRDTVDARYPDWKE